MKTFLGKKRFLALFLGGFILVIFAGALISRDASARDDIYDDLCAACPTGYKCKNCSTAGDGRRSCECHPPAQGLVKKSPTIVRGLAVPAAPAAAELGPSVDPGLLREGLISFDEFKTRMERRMGESLNCPDQCPGDCHMACCWFCKPTFCGAVCGSEPAAVQ